MEKYKSENCRVCFQDSDRLYKFVQECDWSEIYTIIPDMYLTDLQKDYLEVLQEIKDVFNYSFVTCRIYETKEGVFLIDLVGRQDEKTFNFSDNLSFLSKTMELLSKISNIINRGISEFNFIPEEESFYKESRIKYKEDVKVTGGVVSLW